MQTIFEKTITKSINFHKLSNKITTVTAMPQRPAFRNIRYNERITID